ncbi:type I pantothenate kinase [Trueperella bialowiezensis]|uniref:Pantothenate kinase n=1 Tax=Trueperella bialowiezensis TaxID=312285 RepID=A0A3S4Z4K0_9ACTO|nr:type I pantothenate kinase [Trueperella bialowiezensis]VEI12808.1 Pantothenate kinase [Trueperella bialowiezensis]
MADGSSAFVTFSHDEWAELAQNAPLPLTQADLDRLSSLGDPIDLQEADAVYRPLSALMQTYAKHTSGLYRETSAFFRRDVERTPWIVGIAGSVAVGKSTAARLLRQLLSRWPHTPNVDLVPTDGFLYPNAVLHERGIMGRKGFPESYDRRALIDFLHRVKSGEEEVTVPVYDHVSYDIVPGEKIVIRKPDILIVEGLNVLQPAHPKSRSQLTVSDYFDFSIYLDAAESHLVDWYVSRFRSLRSTAFSDERSYFRSYANLSDEEATATARQIWSSINLPNLRENIAPTRSRAKVILTKGADHLIERIQLRKI